MVGESPRKAVACLATYHDAFLCQPLRLLIRADLLGCGADKPEDTGHQERIAIRSDCGQRFMHYVISLDVIALESRKDTQMQKVAGHLPLIAACPPQFHVLVQELFPLGVVAPTWPQRPEGGQGL